MPSKRLQGDLLLLSPIFADIVKECPVVVLDVGARGAIMSPWNDMRKESITLVGLEPDEEECERLRASEKGYNGKNIYLPFGLWSTEGEISLHVAREPSTSSVYPPATEILDRFHPRHGSPRITQRVVSVRSRTVDNLLDDLALSCDFIKLDTHGSEYEILLGARRALNGSVFGVLVETWAIPVHRGQRVTSDVMKLLEGHGFALFDIQVGAGWTRWEGGDALQYSKKQAVGLDLLLFKEPDAAELADLSFIDLAKRAAISEAYGFPDFAIQLLSRASAVRPHDSVALRDLKDVVLRNAEQNTRREFRRRRPLARLLRCIVFRNRPGGSGSIFGPLH